MTKYVATDDGSRILGIIEKQTSAIKDLQTRVSAVELVKIDRGQKYILCDKAIVPVDLMEWAEWFEKPDRRLFREERNGVIVSTVFLGIDHNYEDDDSPPLIFETMIFGGPEDQYQDRCSTYAEAETMHAKAVALAFGEKAAT